MKLAKLLAKLFRRRVKLERLSPLQRVILLSVKETQAAIKEAR